MEAMAPLPFHQKIVAIILAVLILGSILELVRRRRLREEYSWLWLLTGSLLIVFIAWYDLLLNMTKLIGSTSPTLTLFFGAIIFLLLLNLHFSTKISDLTTKLKNLHQETAILKVKKKEEDEKRENKED